MVQLEKKLKSITRLLYHLKKKWIITVKFMAQREKDEYKTFQIHIIEECRTLT